MLGRPNTSTRAIAWFFVGLGLYKAAVRNIGTRHNVVCLLVFTMATIATFGQEEVI